MKTNFDIHRAIVDDIVSHFKLPRHDHYHFGVGLKYHDTVITLMTFDNGKSHYLVKSCCEYIKNKNYSSLLISATLIENVGGKPDDIESKVLLYF